MWDLWLFALFNQVSEDHMFPLSSGLTRGPILNQVLNPLTKARVNSPFKVHSSKNEYDVQRLLYAKFILTFTHGHNVHNGVLYV